MNHKELLRFAYEAAKTSPDPSTKNCTLLVDDNGDVVIVDVNRFPDGIVGRPERLIKPLKYNFIRHAEEMTIAVAARDGIATRGLLAVTPWFPCAKCAGLLVQAGVVAVLVHKQACDRKHDAWKETIANAKIIFKDAGVRVIYYDGKIGVEGALFNGEKWNP